MKRLRQLTRRVSLRNLIFGLLFVSGFIPLATGSILLTRQNISILQTQEQTFLTRSARDLSEDLGRYLDNVATQLEQLGQGYLALSPPGDTAAQLRRQEAERYFGTFLLANRGEVLGLRVLDPQGVGLALGSGGLDDRTLPYLDEGFAAAQESGGPRYQLVRSPANEPLAVLSLVVAADDAPPGSPPALVLQAVVRLDLMDRVFRREAQGAVSVFLIDSDGRVLWEEGADEAMSRALAASGLVRDFQNKPLNLTSEYELYFRGRKQQMLGRVSPVAETGWGVVVQKPLSAAYEAGRRLVVTALVSSIVLVLLSLVFGIIAARRFSAPIQSLAATSHEIAAGKFGERVAVSGPGREIAELAEDFNRMSGHVQGYVERLRAAAQENRELFIGSIRAFAAAVDAKDPYTRGHSERVAEHSRTISRYLGQSEEHQERIWIAGLLHDVGKIGIEDRILKKGGVLTNEEYAIMKLHPVIGADILTPLEPLREMLPAVRWHHEAWNGRGYPDGLQGEAIPLIARIVAVADTFDAITTNRPYQQAYTPEYAVETITKLTGSRFDAKVVTAFLRAFQDGAIRTDRGEPAGEQAAVAAGA